MRITISIESSLSLHWIRFFQKGTRTRICKCYGSICFKENRKSLCITFMKHWVGITRYHKNKHLSPNLGWQPLQTLHAGLRICRRRKWSIGSGIFLQRARNHSKKSSILLIRTDVELSLTISLRMPSEGYNWRLSQRNWIYC